MSRWVEINNDKHFAQVLLYRARYLHSNDKFCGELDQAVRQG